MLGFSAAAASKKWTTNGRKGEREQRRKRGKEGRQCAAEEIGYSREQAGKSNLICALKDEEYQSSLWLLYLYTYRVTL